MERCKTGRKYPQLRSSLKFIRFEKRGVEIPSIYDIDVHEGKVEIGIDWCSLFAVVCRSSNVQFFGLEGGIHLDGVYGRRKNKG